MDVMLNCPSGCETIHHRLKCGTNVFILPKDRNIKVGAVSVGFGSADREFYFDGKSCVIPPGTAHFLEHEMFNRPDGDISEKFAELGAEVNAFTDTEKTVYYFKTAGNFSECFRLLLNFVESTAFGDTDKEREIIKREIDMYSDSCERKAYFGALDELYPSSPLACEIAGTNDSVENINTEILELCHRAFYVPENMTVICSGNVTADEIMTETEKIFFGRERKTAAKYKISAKCAGGKRIDNGNTTADVFCVSYPAAAVFSKNKDSLLLKIISEAAFGEGSELFERLTKEKVMFEVPSVDIVTHSGQEHIAISGRANNTETAMDIIDEELSAFKNGGMDQRKFERERKRLFGTFVRISDDCWQAVNMQAACKGEGLAEMAENIRQLDLPGCLKKLDSIGSKNGRCVVKPWK